MNIYEQQEANRNKTALLLFVFICFFLAIGIGFDFFYMNWTSPASSPQFVFDAETETYRAIKSSATQNIPFGTIIALVFGSISTGASFYNGKKLVLMSTRAYLASMSEPKEKTYINIVKEVSTAAGLPMPAAYIVPDLDPNAFATGTSPDDAAIAVTRGLLEAMNREELQGVVAHEMSHIRNYDIRLMTVLTATVGAIALISDIVRRTRLPRNNRNSSSSSSNNYAFPPQIMAVLLVIWILLVVLSPLLSTMLTMAISRKREYLADASAAELTRNPKGLISALEKIYSATGPTTSICKGVSHLCIMDPRGSLIEESSGFLADMLATHPPMQKRILALKAMAYMPN